MLRSTRGRVHSFETFSTVDGPGIRFVVFLQGCNNRCEFCHNPDTWDKTTGMEFMPQEVMSKVIEYTNFYASSGGGLTVGGGEPLLQPAFLADLFQRAHESGINTCLDTAGDVSAMEPGDIDDILRNTDLVQLDIKDSRGRVNIDNDLILLKELELRKIPTNLRYVFVEHRKEEMDFLRSIRDEYECVKAINVLPYHRLGEGKWVKLGIDYPMKGVPAPSLEALETVREYLE